MRLLSKFGTALLLAVCLAQAQAGQGSSVSTGAAAKQPDRSALSADEQLSLMTAALDSRVQRSEADCSHLVHAIYEQAGMPYNYAPSSELYTGTEGFERVKQPEPGDLVVWRGHVGIVIKPSQHIFFSFLSSGPGTDDYTASHWKRRGKPRFYRYVRSDDCCDSTKDASHRLMKIRK